MGYFKRKLFNFILSQRFFEFCQSHGVSVVRNYFYTPIPDTGELRRESQLLEAESEMAGLNLRVEEQLKFLDEVCLSYRQEYQFPINQPETPYRYFLNCPQFGYQPAALLHCMVRHLKSRKIIEVGSGHSTYVTASACELNRKEGNPSKLLAIEPYPNGVLKKGFPGLSELIIKKVQNVPLDVFLELDANDILFIDSSHVSQIGSDVNYIFLEVLPRLKKGVYVHFHDIFFPKHHPREWLIDKRLFWNEQYLLQAFLCFNRSYDVVFSNYYMNLRYPEKMEIIFPQPEGFKEYHYPSSFWIKKVD